MTAVTTETRGRPASLLPAAVLAALTHESPMTVPQLVTATGATLTAVYQACAALADDGKIRRVKRGLYAHLGYVVPAVKALPSAKKLRRKRLLAALEAASYSPSKAATTLGITRQALHKQLVAAGIARLSPNEWRALRGKTGDGLEIFLTPQHVATLEALGGVRAGAEAVAMALQGGDPVDEAGGARPLRRRLPLTCEARARLLAVAEAHDVSEAQVFRAALERRGNLFSGIGEE